MMELAARTVQCPYCWESIEILVDTSVDQQTYTEDCSVCCHPILFIVQCNDQQVVNIDLEMDE